LAHVDGVELFFLDGVERGRDVGKVERDAVAPQDEVDAVEVADALGLDQRADGPPGDGERAALDAGPLRV
jgi:hypothetical protein